MGEARQYTKEEIGSRREKEMDKREKMIFDRVSDSHSHMAQGKLYLLWIAWQKIKW